MNFTQYLKFQDDQDMTRLLNKHVFYIFDVDLRSKLVFMHEHVMNNQEHVKNI